MLTVRVPGWSYEGVRRGAEVTDENGSVEWIEFQGRAEDWNPNAALVLLNEHGLLLDGEWSADGDEWTCRAHKASAS